MGHARALLATPDRAYQEQLARRVSKEDLSVRAVEELVREHNTEESQAEPAVTAVGAARGRRQRSPGIAEREETRADHREPRVKIAMNAGGRGRITVDFAGLEDLERIYRRLTEEVIAAATE